MQSRRNSKHLCQLQKSAFLKLMKIVCVGMGNRSLILNFRYSGDRMKGFHYTEIRLSKIR